jgi:hypothetical protein
LSAPALSSWLMRHKTNRPMADSARISPLWGLPDDLRERIEWFLNKFDRAPLALIVAPANINDHLLLNQASWSSARSRPRDSRSTWAWTPATTIRRAGRQPKSIINQESRTHSSCVGNHCRGKSIASQYPML